MRLVRTLALLALMAGLVAGCGSGSSSTPAADPVQSLEPGDSAPTDAATGLPTTGTTAGLELRPVYARYASGVPLELGPAAPKDLVKTLSQHACPSPASQLQGMQLECDAGKTVYLLKDPIVTGGVATATAKQIGHKKLWFVEVQLDQQASDQLAAATGQSSGTELAMSFDGTVLTAPVLFKPITDGSFAITGNYNQKQATRLASQLSTG